MAQSQRQVDVHQDELCPPNKRYALMDANKKIDLDNPTMDLLGAVLAYFEGRWIKFSEMAPFFLNDLGFTLELRFPSNFKTTGLVQQWQTLGKMFARCLTTRATSHDQLPLLSMQMLYFFVNNVHTDYAELLWEGLHYLLEHPSTLIHYPIFIKLIVGHYMTSYPEISRRVCDKYHNLEHDEMVKSVFNSRKNKVDVGMNIPSSMIIDEMKRIENYRMYAEAFRVDVPTTQSQLTESTQGMHRITSAPMIPIPDVNERESSAQQKSIVITSIGEQKSRDAFEAQQNVEKVNEHLIAEEIEQLVEGTGNENADENGFEFVIEKLMAWSGTDLKMAKLVMSSPNHPTSDIEDAFSSNFLDYTHTSPDYFPSSSGNISPDPSDNLSKYLLALLAISPFHDMISDLEMTLEDIQDRRQLYMKNLMGHWYGY
ncbi:hypothetical protein Tco_0480479 [Tanacetum coccineum]